MRSTMKMHLVPHAGSPGRTGVQTPSPDADLLHAAGLTKRCAMHPIPCAHADRSDPSMQITLMPQAFDLHQKRSPICIPNAFNLYGAVPPIYIAHVDHLYRTPH